MRAPKVFMYTTVTVFITVGIVKAAIMFKITYKSSYVSVVQKCKTIDQLELRSINVHVES